MRLCAVPSTLTATAPGYILPAIRQMARPRVPFIFDYNSPVTPHADAMSRASLARFA